MILGTLVLDLRLPGCHSLKEKRHALRGMFERVRRDFGVSVAEVEDHDLWGNATIGMAYVGSNAVQAESVLNRILEIFDSAPELQVYTHSLEIERR
jgi:uncharacterized protein YlxP (DUF503 family)